jgi:HK97 family phage major capsid protein
VWTDCCANLNELDLGFNDVEVNCWKVGGFFAVCNATLEDSDIDLAAELIAALGQAIGRALDKAILYGTGSRMPLGIVTRLAQQSQPGTYPTTARAWEDLHSSNMLTAASTGADVLANIVKNLGAAKGKYSRGELVHVMNEKTYTWLLAQAMTVNAAGAVVTGFSDRMPVAGGIIEVIEDVPDYNIISGYYDLYLLAERAGQKFASSEHFRFLADQTVFKGTARYDGQPAIAEGFVVQTVNGASAATTIAFTSDDANSVQAIAINTATATIAGTGTVQLFALTSPGTGTVTWASSNTGKATVSSTGLVTGVASGSCTITATCNDKTAQCSVTVTA